MNLIDKILLYEDQFKNWIEQHRVLWFFSLFLVGILLGVFYSLFLTGTLKQAPMMGVIYSSALILAEATLGGKALN